MIWVQALLTLRSRSPWVYKELLLYSAAGPKAGDPTSFAPLRQREGGSVAGVHGYKAADIYILEEIK